jgi:NAD dependent epimerase/dehydratase family enzyme
MAMALAGYLGTMMAALVALMTLWNSIIGPPALEKLRPQPHPVVLIAQDFPTAKQPGPWGPPVVHGVDEASNAAEDAHLAAAKDAAAEKAKQQLKQARYQKRKEQLARQRQDQDQQFSTALGYDQQPPQDISSASVFSAFGPRRFTTR